jgi:hypothetical protein
MLSRRGRRTRRHRCTTTSGRPPRRGTHRSGGAEPKLAVVADPVEFRCPAELDVEDEISARPSPSRAAHRGVWNRDQERSVVDVAGSGGEVADLPSTAASESSITVVPPSEVGAAVPSEAGKWAFRDRRK